MVILPDTVRLVLNFYLSWMCSDWTGLTHLIRCSASFCWLSQWRCVSAAILAICSTVQRDGIFGWISWLPFVNFRIVFIECWRKERWYSDARSQNTAGQIFTTTFQRNDIWKFQGINCSTPQSEKSLRSMCLYYHGFVWSISYAIPVGWNAIPNNFHSEY